MSCKDCLHYKMCDYGKTGNICADFAEETKEMSAIERLSYYRSLYYVKQRSMEKDILTNDINDYLTSDVVEVVRCKDCKYRPTNGLPNQSCPMWDNGNDFLGSYWKGNDDGFCNYGERRKDDE